MHISWARWDGARGATPAAARGAPPGAWRPVPVRAGPAGPLPAGPARVRRGRPWAAAAAVACSIAGLLLTLRPWPPPLPAAPAGAAGATAVARAGGPAPGPGAAVSPAALAGALDAGASAAPPAQPAWWTPPVAAAASGSGLPAALIAAVVQAESAGDPEAVSPAGAKGLMQLLPATAAALGVGNIFDPAQNAAGGAHYLADWLQAYDRGDATCVGDPAACPQALELALAAYNAGPGAVQKYGGIPPYPETERYVQEVMALYQQYRAEG